MARHIVTVCMFCLLCAAHSCGSHIDMQNDGVLTYDANVKDVDHLNIDLEERERKLPLRYHQKLQKIRQGKTKREVKVNPDTYVTQIFRLYGDSNSMTMNLTGFNKMLEELDLHKLVEGGESIESRDYMYGKNVKDEVVNVSIFIIFLIFFEVFSLN